MQAVNQRELVTFHGAMAARSTGSGGIRDIRARYIWLRPQGRRRDRGKEEAGQRRDRGREAAGQRSDRGGQQRQRSGTEADIGGIETGQR